MTPRLASFHSEFYARAERAGYYTEESKKYLADNGLDREAIAPSIGLFEVLPCKYFAGRRFEFDGGKVPSLVMEATECQDGERKTIDLVAWPVHRPDKVATACGIAIALGADSVANPASYFGGEPLRVWRTPLAWLQAGCKGCVVLDASRAFRWLHTDQGCIAVEDTRHGVELLRALHPFVDRNRVVVPVRERAVA